MNYRFSIKDGRPSLSLTTAAVDSSGVDGGVFGTLPEARQAVADYVKSEIAHLREQRDFWLHIREWNLPRDGEPGNATPDPRADDPLPDAPVHDDLTGILDDPAAAHLRRKA